MISHSRASLSATLTKHLIVGARGAAPDAAGGALVLLDDGWSCQEVAARAR